MKKGFRQLESQLEDQIEDDNVVDIGSSKKKKTREATREEHLELFPQLLGKIKKDIFTDTLLCSQKGHGLWKPVANQLDIIRSECRHLSIDSPIKYAPASIEDHLGYLSSCYPKTIVPEIPRWDGKDRIAEMSAMLIPNENYDITPENIEAVLKEWLANVFRKIEDPTLDNYIQTRSFIFILQGGQQIGKDAWIRMLLCGWGQWLTNFTHGANERDTIMQIHRAAVINVAEFDRLSKYETSFIKDIVTRPDSNMRASHAREEETRESRCSFIASVNPLDILRDTEENTRYCIIPLVGINFNKQRKDLDYSLQILAQAKELMEDDYYATPKDWEPIKALVKDQTPEDSSTQLAEWWETQIDKWLLKTNAFDDKTEKLKKEIRARKYAHKSEIEEFLIEAGKVFGLKRNVLLSRLYNSGLRYREPIGGSRCIKISRNSLISTKEEGKSYDTSAYDGCSDVYDTTTTDTTTDYDCPF